MSSDADLSQSPKPDVAQFSFRPQRPAKKTTGNSATSSIAPAMTTPNDAETQTLLRDSSSPAFIEKPTNEKEHIYTRAWLYAHRLHESVEPEPGILTRLKQSQAYRSSYTSNSGGSSSTSGFTSSPREIPHKDRRGSSGSRTGRSGSGTFNPGASYGSNSMVGSSSYGSSYNTGSSSNRPRGGSGSSGQNAQTSTSPNTHSTPFSPTSYNQPTSYTHMQWGEDSSSGRHGGNASSSDGKGSSRPPRRFSITNNDTNKFYSELVGLLNKLTIEKFDLLAAQIVAKFDQIETPEVFTDCVKLLHSKALLEQSFSAMYADLVKLLDKIYAFEASTTPTTPSSSDGALSVPTSTSTTRSSSPTRIITNVSASPSTSVSTSPSMVSVSFISTYTPSSSTTSSSTTTPPPGSRIDRIRSDAGVPSSTAGDTRSASPIRPRADSSGTKSRPVGLLRKSLLNNCYYVWQEAMEGKLSLIGEDEVAVKARNRVMGNMTFMGELYKRGLMPLRVLKSSADGLVSNIRDKMTKNACAVVEPHCIMLYSLLRTVGEYMDKDKLAKPVLEGYMEDLMDFASHRGFQARVRFLLRDVIDDKLNDWRPRRRFEGPMKLEDLKELHEADLINPLTLQSRDRMSVPSSEFEERNKQRQSISPARKAGSKDRSGSGINASNSASTISTSSSSGSSTSLSPSGKRSGSIDVSSLATIKEPASYSPRNRGNLSPTGSFSSSTPHSKPSLSPTSSQTSLPTFPKDLVSEALRNEHKLHHVLDHLRAHPSSAEREMFVYELLNWIMDRPMSEQSLAAPFLRRLVQKEVILTDQHVTQGFILLMKTLEDLTVDVPQAPALIGKRLHEMSDLISPDQKNAIISHCPARCAAKFTKEASPSL